MYKRISKDKEHYPDGWKDMKINPHLAETLEDVEEYLKQSQEPTRKERMERAVATIHPMGNHFHSETQKAKQKELFLSMGHVFKPLLIKKALLDINEFRKCLEKLEVRFLELLGPITTQDQRAIQTILEKPKRSDNDVERMFSLIERRGANSTYFFKHAHETEDTTWIPLLEERGYFANPPSVEHTGDGRLIFPIWWPMRYLKRMVKQAPNEIVDIVRQFPQVNNPWIHSEILDIAWQLHGKHSLQLKAKIIESTSSDYRFWVNGYGNLLDHWAVEKQISHSLELTREIFSYEFDPESEDNSRRINPLEYKIILMKGVHRLAEHQPYEVACILIDALATMIQSKADKEDLDNDEDHSSWWARSLDKSEDDDGLENDGLPRSAYIISKRRLLDVLIFACEKVYDKSPHAIVDLDNMLQKKRWKIFKRLRQHVFAHYPNEQTLQPIREMIRRHEDYHLWDYDYEFQRMTRIACNYFGASLLTKEESTRIFDLIRSGPSKDDFRNWLSEEFTEEKFQKRQRYFHRKQFTPFRSVLFDEHATYFQELETEDNSPISDDDYLSFRVTSLSTSKRSPFFHEELANLSDEDLLTYINEWDQEECIYTDTEIIETDIESLTAEFRSVFRDQILRHTDRHGFWLENCHRIERPAYVRTMISAMQEYVKEKKFEKLHEWLRFSEWVLSHPEQDYERDYRQRRHVDESRDNPDWSDSRRAVGDFIGVCLQKDVGVPVSFAGQLSKLLEMLCTQFEWRLDSTLNRFDPFTMGINCTRSRALQDLVKFGQWLRSLDSPSEVSAVTNILKKRFARQAEIPLTLPEYAILGTNYNQIFYLNSSWATEKTSDFFPQGSLTAWLAAFGSYAVYADPFEPSFDTLKNEYEFALEHLHDFEKSDGPEGISINHLGEHMFICYLRGVYPLRGEDSMLEQYYEATSYNREYWANLFSYVGKTLRDHTGQLNETLKDKIYDFFDWRLAVEESTELRHFTLWLDAKCLEYEWRLNSYSKILDVCRAEEVSITFSIDTLSAMLPDYTGNVVECFIKLIGQVSDTTIGMFKEEAKTILQAGIGHHDQKVSGMTVTACENLIAEGKFDFSELFK